MKLRSYLRRRRAKVCCPDCEENANINPISHPINKSKGKRTTAPLKNGKNTTFTGGDRGVRKVVMKRNLTSPKRTKNVRTALKNNEMQLAKTEEADVRSLRRSTRDTEKLKSESVESRNEKENILKTNSSRQEQVENTESRASNQRSRKKRALNLEKEPQTKKSEGNSHNSLKENGANIESKRSNAEKASGGKIKRDLKDSSKKTSASFLRYGMVVPSYEDILKEREECNRYHDIISSFEKSIVPTQDIKFDIPDDDPPEELKDCKHMSVDSIVSGFERNLDYLSKIRDGITYCKRHELFQGVITSRGLIYNSSMVLFKDEHKQLLIEKLCEQYGDDLTSTDYYFKVLLPELCLKIFMDEYSMTHEEATKYLNYD